MRALVYRGPGQIGCESVPDPEPPDPDGVTVRVERTAICGSDLHIYHGHLPQSPGFSVGHEAIGEVVETGRRVTRFRSGDRVLVSGVVGCGGCAPCRRGQVDACEVTGPIVFGNDLGLAGAQAEALAVPRADNALHAIPEGLSPEQAVLLTDILPTGYFGARNAEIRPGQDVAIIGMGPVGLMALLCARLFGAARIFALDRVPDRLELAAAQGAIPIDVSGDAAGVLRDATDGLGPHAVIEAVGATDSIRSALDLVRRGGVVSVVGVNVDGEFPFPMATALMKGVTFRIGICPVPACWPDLVPLVARGGLAPEFVFTHHLGLSEGQEAYDLFAGRRDGVIKVLLDPTR